MLLERITMDIPADLIPFVSRDGRDIPDKIFEYLILELYRTGEISSGKASQYLGMERFEFIRFASRLGIDFINIKEEDLAKDHSNLTKAVKRKSS